jgi:hypothetical protein
MDALFTKMVKYVGKSVWFLDVNENRRGEKYLHIIHSEPSKKTEGGITKYVKSSIKIPVGAMEEFADAFADAANHLGVVLSKQRPKDDSGELKAILFAISEAFSRLTPGAKMTTSEKLLLDASDSLRRVLRLGGCRHHEVLWQSLPSCFSEGEHVQWGVCTDCAQRMTRTMTVGTQKVIG